MEKYIINVYKKFPCILRCIVTFLLVIMSPWNASLIDCPVINGSHVTYEELNSKVEF